MGEGRKLTIHLQLPGADKSLARPGKKQARKHSRDAREFNNIETRADIKFLLYYLYSCKNGGN